MLRRGLVETGRTALRVTLATVMFAGTYVALSFTQSGAATSASRASDVERRDQRRMAWSGQDL